MNRTHICFEPWQSRGWPLLSAVPQYAADVRHLTLTEAVHLAISQNRALKIARLKVVENEQKKAGERSAYFPPITNQSNALHITDLQNIGIPAGALGRRWRSAHSGAGRHSSAGPEDLLLQRHAAFPAADTVDPDSRKPTGSPPPK